MAGEKTRSAMKAPPSFSTLFSIGPALESVFGNLTQLELLKRADAVPRVPGLGGCRAAARRARGLTMRPADMAAGLQA